MSPEQIVILVLAGGMLVILTACGMIAVHAVCEWMGLNE